MKLLLVCSHGGHFSTMRGLKDFWGLHERVWVTHRNADTEMLEGSERVHWVRRQDSRDLLPAILNFPTALRLIRAERPDLILSTGAAVAVPFFYAAKIFGFRTIFVESISRVTGLSLACRLVRPVVDEVFVQWPECAKKNAGTRFEGQVL